jgi:DNA-binding beta-propeller fold protein YncE
MQVRLARMSGVRRRFLPAVLAATVLVLTGAGCSGGSASSPPAATPLSTASIVAPASLAPLPAGSVPGCSTATGPASLARGVHPVLVKVPGNPFGIVISPDGRWAFVALGGSVGVFRLGSAAPALVRMIAVPGMALGETLTSDGRYLLVANGGGGAVVISVPRAEQGAGNPVAGVLSSGGPSSGAIEVAVSPDGRFAFVTLEGQARAAVFSLADALATGFGPSDLVGYIPLGLAPVGMAVSPDGRWLYATSELARGRQPGFRRGVPGGLGTLSVIDLNRAETQPARSVVATVPAGCSPVRVVTSADGSQLWVTARESDDLLCFSAALLRSQPGRALVARVRVGEAPVGLALVRNGSRLVVADSNRFRAAGGTSSLAVVSVPAALAGRPALLGLVPAGQFPREMAVTPDGRSLLVGNYASGQLEVVDVASLP